MQVPQLAFQGRAQPPPEPQDQAVAAPTREIPEHAPQPAPTEEPPREQLVQGLVVGGAALVYEDALEPLAPPERPTLQAPGGVKDQVAQAPVIGPEPPTELPQVIDIPDVVEAPEPPQPPPEGSVPEPPDVETPVEGTPPEMEAPRVESPAPASGRRWFLRRRPSAQPEPESADEAAMVEQPGLALPEIEETPAPAAEAPELQAVVPLEVEEEPYAAAPEVAPQLAAPEVAAPQPVVPQEAEPPAVDEIAALAYPAAIEEPEPDLAVEEPVRPLAGEDGLAEQEAPEPVQPRARKWLRRRGPSASPELAPMAPSEEAVDEERGLEAPAEDQALPAGPQKTHAHEVVAEPAQTPLAAREAQLPPSERPAPAAARPVEQAHPTRRPQPQARPANIPERPAASVTPAPVAPPEAEPQAPPAWSDQPYYVEASPEHAAEPSPGFEPTPEAKPSIRERLKRRRPVSPSSTPVESPAGASTPPHAAEAQISDPPASVVAREVEPAVSAAPAPAQVVSPSPDASVVPSLGALAPPPSSPLPTPAPVAPPPPPAPAQMAPLPPPAPVVPPSPPARIAPPLTTSAWKSSTPQPPSATAHPAGIPTGPSPATMETTCPRCGEPSPRGLCETCEYALLELRELMIGLSGDQ